MDETFAKTPEEIADEVLAEAGLPTGVTTKPNGNGTHKLGDTGHDHRCLISRRASDIMPRDIEFLWVGRLACGKHTCIAGEPGTGKSQLSIAIAAAISTGGEWPCDEGRAPLGNVIMLNAEDFADDTIVPRLIAAGADLARIHIVNAVATTAGANKAVFNLQTDLCLLEKSLMKLATWH
jgi:AAA domain